MTINGKLKMWYETQHINSLLLKDRDITRVQLPKISKVILFSLYDIF